MKMGSFILIRRKVTVGVSSFLRVYKIRNFIGCKKRQKEAKLKKKRTRKLEEMVAINGTFAYVFKVIKKNKEENKK